MLNPSLTWFFNQKPITNETYIGSYESSDLFECSVTVINNYLGTEARKDINNGRLVLMFKDYEDAALLHDMQVRLDGAYEMPLEILENRGYAEIPRTLSGDYDTPENCTLNIHISIKKSLMVKSDLKRLIMDIIY